MNYSGRRIGFAGATGATGVETVHDQAPMGFAGARRVRTILAGVLIVAAAAALAFTLGAPGRSPAGSPASTQTATAQHGWLSVPVAERATVSRSLGADLHSYWAAQSSHGAVALSNPDQGLRATFNGDRVAVAGRHGLKFGLSALAVGRIGSLAPAVLGSPQVSHNRIAYSSPAIAEWFVNGPLGVEQGFTLTHRPAGSGTLQISQQLAGNLTASVSAGGQDATFTSRAGTLHYENLVVTDARGHRVPARLSIAAHRLTITVTDAHAVYPLRIDPVIVTPVTQSPASNADTGTEPFSVAFSPDGALLATANWASSTVSVFTVDKTNGQLTPVTQSTASNADTGSGPYSVAFSPSGGLLETANYTSQTVSVFTVDEATGQLTPVTQSPASKANTTSGPFSVTFSPSGGLLATANVDTNTVSIFTVDQATGQLAPVTQSPASNADTGSGPASVAFSPTGLLATANYDSNTVSTFTVNQATGQLTPVAQSPASNADTGSGPASVAFSPDGGLLATANYESSTVSAFTVDEATGQLTPVTQSPASNADTGTYPFAVAFSPNGALLATENFGSASVSLFGVGDASGQLTPLPQSPASDEATGWRPVGLAFSPDGGLLATADRNENTVSLFTIAGSATQAKFALSPSSITADGFTTTVATATMTDAHGNPISGENITITSNGAQQIGAVTAGATPGTYQATITSTTTAGTANITATDTSVTGVSDSQTLTQVAGPATSAVLVLAPASITANGTSTTVATATLTDAHGNPVSGDTVTIGSAGAQGISAVTAGATPGTYQATIISTTTAAPASITATDTSVSGVSDTQTLTQTAGPATSVVLALAPSSITADGSSTTLATATVTDTHGNPVSGDTVTIGSAGSQNVGAVTAGSTPGTYQATITSTKTPGTATITAADTSVGGVSDTQTLTQTVGPATSVALALSPSSITADGSSTSVATTTVTDANRNPVSGDSVTIQSTGGQKIGPVTAGTTPGTYQATITSTKTAGTATITASDTSVTVSNTRTLTQVAGPATALTLALSPASINANGVSTATATAAVTDANGNAVSGEAVTIHSTGSQTIGPVTAGTTPGTYQATITSTKTAGTATISATDTSVSGVSSSRTLTQTAGPATTVTFTLSPSSIAADGTTSTVATATVTDPFGNPVSGDTVTFTSNDSQHVGAVTVGSTPGTYQATITSTTTPGSATITATDTSAGAVAATQTLTQTALPVVSNTPPVSAPAYTFKIISDKRLANGDVVVMLKLSGAGTIQAFGMHPSAHAAKHGKAAAWGPIKVTRTAAGLLKITLRPDKAAEALLSNARRIGSRLHVRVTVAFSPSNGSAQTKVLNVRLLKARKA